jgi:prepilin-type N-terminal cleavage/methylation domain-containing protein
MPARNGFTLIEALITTVVLVTGLAAVAGVFSYSALVSLRTQQFTAALTLVSRKMEDLRAADDLTPGRYAEYVGPGDVFMRHWEITAEMPSRITVIVYGRPPGRRGPYFELARATTRMGRKF